MMVARWLRRKTTVEVKACLQLLVSRYSWTTRCRQWRRFRFRLATSVPMARMDTIDIRIRTPPYLHFHCSELTPTDNSLNFVEEILQANTHPLEDKAAPMLNTKIFYLEFRPSALQGLLGSLSFISVQRHNKNHRQDNTYSIQ